MIHALKLTQPYFDDMVAGDKPFEIRKADRPYEIGDFLALNEWNGEYTGRATIAEIIYVLSDAEYIKEGYVVLGISLSKIVTIDPLYALGACYCRECMHYRMGDESLGDCEKFKNSFIRCVKSTDFCSYGERTTKHVDNGEKTTNE